MKGSSPSPRDEFESYVGGIRNARENINDLPEFTPEEIEEKRSQLEYLLKNGSNEQKRFETTHQMTAEELRSLADILEEVRNEVRRLQADQQEPSASEMVEVVVSATDTVILATEAFQGRFESLKKLPDSTQEEREEKNRQLTELSQQVKKKRNEFLDEGKSQDNVEKLSELLTEIRKMNGTLETLITKETARLRKVEGVKLKIEDALQKALDKSNRGEKIEALEKVIANIQEAPKKLEEKKVVTIDPKELEDIKQRAEQELHRLQREALGEEFEAIQELDRNGQPPRILKQKLEELSQKAKAIPQSQELLEEIQAAISKVDEALSEQKERKKQVAQAVRIPGAKVRLHLQEASAAKDQPERHRNIVEAIQALQEEVFDEEGNPIDEKVAALRQQFEGSPEALYRIVLLDWVLTHRGVKVTAENLGEVMKSLPKGNDGGNGENIDEKNVIFLREQQEIAQVDDPGQRFHRLNQLLQKVRNSIARDHQFASKYGDQLLHNISEQWRECRKEVSDRLQDVRDRDDEDSKAIVKKFEEAENPEELDLHDTQALARIIDYALIDGAQSSEEKHRREDDHEWSQQPSSRISRRAAWTTAAVLALLAGGAWYLKKPSTTDGETVSTSTTSENPPIIEPDSEPLPPVTPRPPDPQELARRDLERRQNDAQQRLDDIERLQTLDDKLRQLQTLLNELRDKDGLEQLVRRAETMKQALEREQLLSRLQAYMKRYEDALKLTDELAKDHLEALQNELSTETASEFSTLREQIKRSLEQVQAALDRAAQREAFQQRLREITTLTPYRAQREALDQLMEELRKAGDQDLLNEAQRVETVIERAELERQLETIPTWTDLSRKRRALQQLLDHLQTRRKFLEFVPRIQNMLQQVEQELQAATFAQRLQAVASLQTDQEKKAALEVLIRDMTTANLQSNPTFTQAQTQLREVEASIAAANKPPEQQPTQPTSPSVISELQSHQHRAALDATRITLRIETVQREIETWRNHLVLEDAQRRQQALAEKGNELSRLQDEQRQHQEREVMLRRVLGLRGEAAMRTRLQELESEMNEHRRQLQSMQQNVRQLEAILVRTPGEEESLANGRAWVIHHEAEIRKRTSEKTEIERLLASTHQDDAARRQ